MPYTKGNLLVIPRYAVTACETDHYILVVFVVMSKEEGSMYRGRLHIPVVLDRMSTSQTVLKLNVPTKLA